MKIQTNQIKFSKNLGHLKNQINKQNREVVNTVANSLKKRMQLGLNKAIDKPTPFTKKAVHSTKAFNKKGQGTTASVFIKPIQAAYLDKQLSPHNSDRQNDNSIVPIPKQQNKYGNLRGKRKLKSNPRIHSIRVTGKPYKAMLFKRNAATKGAMAKQASKGNRVRTTSKRMVLVGIIKDERYNKLFDWYATGYKFMHSRQVQTYIQKKINKAISQG